MALSKDAKLSKKLLAGEDPESQAGMSKSGEKKVYEKERGGLSRKKATLDGKKWTTPGKYFKAKGRTLAIPGG